MLKVENLCVNFGDFKALRNVSLEIPDGEFFTLLGPSGCGKTTTLRAITGFITPVSGSITINGKEITEIPVEKRNIGMVFQSYALFPTMTVYQNIAFPLKVKKLKVYELDEIVKQLTGKDEVDADSKEQISALVGKIRQSKKIEDDSVISALAQKLGIEQEAFKKKIVKLALFARTYNKLEIDDIVRNVASKVDLVDEQLVKNVSELSGGQQQRVAIARALASDPPILCLDEPLSNLDAKLRVQLRGELKELQKKLGITMVYVTHDQEEALTLSDHICVFKKGEVDQIGTPNEIYNASKTEYTYNFIGDINRLSKELVEKINKTAKTNIDVNKNSYIRLERIHLNREGEGYFTTEAVVDKIDYYGMYIKYYLKVGEDTVKAIEKNDGAVVYNIGDKVKIGFKPSDILSFVPEEEKDETPKEKPKTKLDKIKSVFTSKKKTGDKK